MISANIVTQILTVSQTTTSTKGMFGGGGEHRCECGKPDDFISMLDSIAARQMDGIISNSQYFSDLNSFSFPDSPSSDMVDLIAGILDGDGEFGDEQSPFDFLQSLSTTQLTTFQAVHYSNQSPNGDSKTVKSIQVIMERIADVDDSEAVFPPLTAPAEVKDAWESATQGVSPRDVLLVSGMLFGMAFSQMNDETADTNNTDLAVTEQKNNQDIFSWELDQYWEQVEALLALIDKSLQKDPEKSSDLNGAKELITDFLAELDEADKTEETTTVS
ncbi:MAG: hypothetical protein HQL69_22925 [Magnetococcales bacterium]|nr:hypothetical protein [Magnetococcales bacterium]